MVLGGSLWFLVVLGDGCWLWCFLMVFCCSWLFLVVLGNKLVVFGVFLGFLMALGGYR